MLSVAQLAQLIAALSGATLPQLTYRLSKAATHFFAAGDYELASELRDLAAQLTQDSLRAENNR